MGQEGVVPDEGLEVAADDVVLLHDVDRDALGLDEVADVRDDVEEAADVVGAVDLAQDGLEALALLLGADEAGLDVQPLLDLADEPGVEEALDLGDLAQDVLDLALLEAEGAAELDGLRLEAGVLDDPAQGPEEAEVARLAGGGPADLDVEARRPLVGRAQQPFLVGADEQDAGRRADRALEGGGGGEGRVDDRRRDVALGEEGQGGLGIGGGQDRTVLLGQAGEAVGFRINGMDNDDPFLDHSPRRAFSDETRMKMYTRSLPAVNPLFGLLIRSGGYGIFSVRDVSEETINGEIRDRARSEHPGPQGHPA